jgi:ABC-type multidrug transport system fused ATPase/permease subunit
MHRNEANRMNHMRAKWGAMWHTIRSMAPLTPAMRLLVQAGNAAVAYLAPLLAERFGLRLRKRLLSEVVGKPQTFFDTSSKGDLVSRLTVDANVLQTTLADITGQRGFRSLFEVLGAMAIM